MNRNGNMGVLLVLILLVTLCKPPLPGAVQEPPRREVAASWELPQLILGGFRQLLTAGRELWQQLCRLLGSLLPGGQNTVWRWPADLLDPPATGLFCGCPLGPVRGNTLSQTAHPAPSPRSFGE